MVLLLLAIVQFCLGFFLPYRLKLGRKVDLLQWNNF